MTRKGNNLCRRYIRVAAALLILILGGWLGVRWASPDTAAPPSTHQRYFGIHPTTPESRTLPPLVPRDYDPRVPSLAWSLDSDSKVEDAIQLNEYIRATLSAGEFDSWPELGTFQLSIMAVGQPGELGNSLRACALRYESKTTDLCHWSTSLRMRRTGPNSGEIVGVSAQMGAASDAPTCRAFASCSASAWSTASGSFPMPDVFGDDFSFTQAGRDSYCHSDRPGTQLEQYTSLRENREYELEIFLEALRHAETPHARQAAAQNIGFYRRQIDEFMNMEKLLAEGDI